MVELFEEATKSKYRFPSSYGNLSAEDLFDLGVEDLDTVFKTLNADLKVTTEESLLEKKSAEDVELANKIEIIRYIVALKQEEARERLLEQQKAAKKQRILEIMADKQDQNLKDMSLDELQAIVDNL